MDGRKGEREREREEGKEGVKELSVEGTGKERPADTQFKRECLHSRSPDYTKGIFQSIGFKEFHAYLILSEKERASEKVRQRA